MSNTRPVLTLLAALLTLCTLPLSVLAAPNATVESTVALPLCGNGITETGEQCDGSDLTNKSCVQLGYTGGTLSCTPACDFNTTACNGASPAQVLIRAMHSTTPPNIAADVRFTNEGALDTEYQYEWCVVSSAQNECGGGDDTAYASAAKLITAGANFDTTLTASVPLSGTYYFKTNVYYGLLSSSASVQFVAKSASGVSTPSSGSVGISSGPMTAPVTSKTATADMNHDGKVDGVDFSILLAFWNTAAPFANPGVDLNGDGVVNAADFSILLYYWGTKPQ